MYYVFSYHFLKGTGLDLPLLEWLNKYTFPNEAKFKDTQYARKVYDKAIKRGLSCGTTTCSWFATLHLDASKVVDISFYIPLSQLTSSTPLRLWWTLSVSKDSELILVIRTCVIRFECIASLYACS